MVYNEQKKASGFQHHNTNEAQTKPTELNGDYENDAEGRRRDMAEKKTLKVQLLC